MGLYIFPLPVNHPWPNVAHSVVAFIPKYTSLYNNAYILIVHRSESWRYNLSLRNFYAELSLSVKTARTVSSANKDIPRKHIKRSRQNRNTLRELAVWSRPTYSFNGVMKMATICLRVVSWQRNAMGQGCAVLYYFPLVCARVCMCDFSILTSNDVKGNNVAFARITPLGCNEY